MAITALRFVAWLRVILLPGNWTWYDPTMYVHRPCSDTFAGIAPASFYFSLLVPFFLPLALSPFFPPPFLFLSFFPSFSHLSRPFLPSFPAVISKIKARDGVADITAALKFYRRVVFYGAIGSRPLGIAKTARTVLIKGDERSRGKCWAPCEKPNVLLAH